jgi:FkbM family methyltransferase
VAAPFNLAFIRDVGPLRWACRWGWRQFTKRVLRRDMAIRLPTGLRLMLPCSSGSASEVFVTGCDVDWGSEPLLARFAEPGRDVLDIGAHIGYYALYLAPLARRVYAFEPDARNLPALVVNARHAGNVEVLAKAVADRPGSGQLDVGGTSEISSLCMEGGGKGAVAVEVTSIDAFVAAIPGCDPAVIKIDVEGQDLAVLRGGTQTLARHRPVVLTEFTVGPGRGNDVAELARLTRDIGYQVFGFVRPSGAPKSAIRFRSIDLLAPARHGSAKMLFLVPQERLSGLPRWDC